MNVCLQVDANGALLSKILELTLSGWAKYYIVIFADIFTIMVFSAKYIML